VILVDANNRFNVQNTRTHRRLRVYTTVVGHLRKNSVTNKEPKATWYTSSDQSILTTYFRQLSDTLGNNQHQDQRSGNLGNTHEPISIDVSDRVRSAIFGSQSPSEKRSGPLGITQGPISINIIIRALSVIIGTQ
jgi:hypothetical protein